MNQQQPPHNFLMNFLKANLKLVSRVKINLYKTFIFQYYKERKFVFARIWKQHRSSPRTMAYTRETLSAFRESWNRGIRVERIVERVAFNRPGLGQRRVAELIK